MPAYSNSTYKVPAIYPADTVTVWNAETVTTGSASTQAAVCEDFNDGYLQTISAEINFSATPGTFKIDVQTADTDTDAAYQVLPNNTGQVTTVGTGNYCSIGLQIKAKFVRLFMTTQPSNAVTVTAKVTR